jgi:hypothetical protein
MELIIQGLFEKIILILKSKLSNKGIYLTYNLKTKQQAVLVTRHFK